MSGDHIKVPSTTLEKWAEEDPNGSLTLAALNALPADSDVFFSAPQADKVKKELFAAPIDPRFPQQQQQRHCYEYYVDYHRCLTLKGEDYAPCNYFKKIYTDLCPSVWIENWDSWVEENRFPARFDR